MNAMFSPASAVITVFLRFGQRVGLRCDGQKAIRRSKTSRLVEPGGRQSNRKCGHNMAV
ncbi:hypothetical protein SMB34_07250 [Thalassospira permensis NBRC 106175]|uniref:Uncharacterized protein n=1 Tax=Thalassospira permensis NBRC 106175 TaxID=1353532 RepID=A0ABR4TJE5_9PROT|nr:hypothetical protein SMB34_07250 [Thalassospira permensis NBRC 106175]